MAGSYYGSISKMNMNLKMTFFLSGLSQNTQFPQYAISAKWKTLISNYSDIDDKNLHQNHHIIKGTRILSTNKLTSKEIIFLPESRFS